jgi:hypothetical protein
MGTLLKSWSAWWSGWSTAAGPPLLVGFWHLPPLATSLEYGELEPFRAKTVVLLDG